MKKKNNLWRFLARVALLAGIVSLLTSAATETRAQLAPGRYSSFGGGSTAQGATNSFLVMSANSANAGTPVVTYYNATSDLALSTLRYWQTTN